MNSYYITVVRRNLNLLIIGVAILSLMSCGSPIYKSATYGSIKSYTPKQEYRGKDTSAVYVAASISTGAHKPLEDVKDRKTIISAQLHKSVTRKYFNLHYGLGASYGAYKFGSSFENSIKKNERKTFYSVDAKIGMNINLPTKRVDWRLLGFELGYNYEFGPFQKKLKDIENNTSALVANRKSIFSYNINTEVVFKLSNLDAFAFGLFFEDLLDKSDKKNVLHNTNYIGAVFSYKHKRFTFSYLAEDNWSIKSNATMHKFGLTYQLF